MARRHTEEVSELLSPTRGTLSEQPPREPHGVDDLRGNAAAGEPLDLPVEEGDVEACVVGHEDAAPGEGEETADGEVGWRCATERPGGCR